VPTPVQWPLILYPHTPLPAAADTYAHRGAPETHDARESPDIARTEDAAAAWEEWAVVGAGCPSKVRAVRGCVAYLAGTNVIRICESW